MAKRLKLYLYLAKTTVHVEEKHTELRLEKIIIEPHSTSESLTLQLCFVRMTTDSNGAVNVTTRHCLFCMRVHNLQTLNSMYIVHA